jgi:hypothetical protein
MNPALASGRPAPSQERACPRPLIRRDCGLIRRRLRRRTRRRDRVCSYPSLPGPSAVVPDRSRHLRSSCVRAHAPRWTSGCRSLETRSAPASDSRGCDNVPAARSGADRWRPTRSRGAPTTRESGCAAPGTSPRAEPRCSHDAHRLCVNPRFATRAQAQLSQRRHTRWRGLRQAIPKQSSEAPLFYAYGCAWAGGPVRR